MTNARLKQNILIIFDDECQTEAEHTNDIWW
jgi:hypothetical protein